MQLSTAQRHRLNSATLLTVAGVCGPIVAASLVLGSGILPVRFGLLLLGALLIGVINSLPAILFGRRRLHFNVLAVIAILATILATSALFIYYQETGLEHAKRYAETWAAAVKMAKEQGGEWPQSITEALPQRKPAHPQVPWPYLSFCGDEWCKVAGYFVSYRPDTPRPHLVVARRDITLEWDWSALKWRELSPRSAG
jgi:hypothetical protein